MCFPTFEGIDNNSCLLFVSSNDFSVNDTICLRYYYSVNKFVPIGVDNSQSGVTPICKSSCFMFSAESMI